MTTEPEAIPAVDELAQEIRRVDGSNSLGAGALAEALMPFLTRASRAPVDGAVAKRCAEIADELSSDELFLDEKGRFGAELTAATIREEFNLPDTDGTAAPRRHRADTKVIRSGKAVQLNAEERADRDARGLHVEWAEGVGYHYFPSYDPKSVAPAPASPDVDWRDDPSADERWNAGLDFGMEQLCKAIGVDPQQVTWDAATETVDGDVQSVIWNILRTTYGEDFPPVPSPDAEMVRALRQKLDEIKQQNEVNIEYARQEHPKDNPLPPLFEVLAGHISDRLNEAYALLSKHGGDR